MADAQHQALPAAAGEGAPRLPTPDAATTEGDTSIVAVALAFIWIAVVACGVAYAITSEDGTLIELTFPQFVGVAIGAGALTVAVCYFVREPLSAGLAAIAGALAVATINAELYTRYYSDDAYITLRYARNLSDGSGPVWNPGERVEGYTDFAWMALLAALHRLGADLVDASLWLSYGSLVVALIATWLIWKRWAGEAGGLLGQPAVLAGIAVTIAFTDPTVYWGFSGLETGLAAALLVAIAYLYMHERRHDGVPWSALAAAAGAMTRPELIVVAAVTGLFTARDAIERRDEKSIARVVVWAALFGLTYVPYFLWRFAYYGHFFPNTYYVKVGSGEAFLDRGMGYLHLWGSLYLFLPLVFGAVALAIAGTRDMRRDAYYVLAVVAAWGAAVAFEGGDAFGHGRFLGPLVPLLTVAGVSGLALVIDRAANVRRDAAIAGAALLIVAWLSLSRASADPTLPATRQSHDDRIALGLWLRDNVPQDYTIAVYAAGAVPYYAELPAIDMLGLTDETIAHSDVPDFGKGIAGHEKYNIDYILGERQPELIMYGDSAPFVLPRSEMERLRGALVAYTALLDDPRLFEMYEPSAIRYEDRWFNFLQRKDVLGTVPAHWTESGGFASPPP